MFHKHNSFTNTLSPTDQLSAYTPQSLGTVEATNNFFVAPQPKGRQPGGSGPDSAGSLAGRQLSIIRFLTSKFTARTSALVTKAQAVASTASQAAEKTQSAASTLSHNTPKAQTVAASSSHSAPKGHTAAASSSSHGAVANSSHGSNAAAAHGHGHGSHAAPWEGVNLWRTPYKGDGDTVTQVKRSKGTLDKYVENRTRRIQQMQLFALRHKAVPTWVMVPRDKIILAVEGAIAAYVLYQVTSTVYNHLKAKDRLKLLKLLYKDNVD